MASVADSLSQIDPKTLVRRVALSSRRKMLYASMFHGHIATTAHNGTIRCKKLIPKATEETLPGLAKALDTFSRLLADVLAIPLGSRGAKTVPMAQLRDAAAQLCQDDPVLEATPATSDAPNEPPADPPSNPATV